MKNIIKIKEDTMAEIKMLQSKFQESVYKMGNLYVEKIGLDAAVESFVEREKSLREEWSSLQKLERDLLDKIVATYGEGNLNMQDGTFVPVNSSPVPSPVLPPPSQ